MTSMAYIAKLVSLGSIEEVWSMHCEAMAGYGFDRLLYGVTHFKTESSFGDMEDALILSNHSQAYLDRFFGEEDYRNGPMMKWCADNTGACSWSWIERQRKDGKLTEEELAVLASNHELGVTAGYTISFEHASGRVLAAIGMTAKAGLSQTDVDQIWAENEMMLMLLNTVTHLKLSNLPSSRRNRLTSRQREVLEWVADGKTIADIASLMDRKVGTVEKHLRLAREAMSAETTAQAVLKASVQNQIFRL